MRPFHVPVKSYAGFVSFDGNRNKARDEENFHDALETSQ